MGLNRLDVLELFQKLEPQGWFCEWNEVYEMEQVMQTPECRLQFRLAMFALRSFSFVQAFNIQPLELSELFYILKGPDYPCRKSTSFFLMCLLKSQDICVMDLWCLLKNQDICVMETEKDFSFAARVLGWLIFRRSLDPVKAFLEKVAKLSGYNLYLFWNKLGLWSEVEFN